MTKQVRRVYQDRTLLATKVADDYVIAKDMLVMFGHELNRKFDCLRRIPQAKECWICSF